MLRWLRVHLARIEREELRLTRREARHVEADRGGLVPRQCIECAGNLARDVSANQEVNSMPRTPGNVARDGFVVDVRNGNGGFIDA